jgi:hypothetical protein
MCSKTETKTAIREVLKEEGLTHDDIREVAYTVATSVANERLKHITPSKETHDFILATTATLASMKTTVEQAEETMKSLVSKESFTPVRNVVYGMVGVVMVAVLNWLLNF